MSMHRSTSGFLRVLALAGAAMATSAWAPAALADTCTKADAAREYREARSAFDAKRYDEAIALLRHLYECDKSTVYLQNIARAHEEANRPRLALAAWREYAEKNPADKKFTDWRIATLEKTIEEQERAAREKAEPTPADPKPRDADKAPETTRPPQGEPAHASTVPAWIVTGVGVAGLALGATFGVLSGSRHDDAVAERNVVRARSHQDDAETFAVASNVAFIAGGIAIAVGGTWLFLSARSGPSTSAGASVIGRF